MSEATEQVTADRKALEKLSKADSGDYWEAVETDEPTPEDAHSRHRTVVRLLKANLAGQAVMARVLIRHDDWVTKASKAWDIVSKAGNSKLLWLLGGVLTLRPEVIPEWLREAFWAAIKASGG